MNYYKCIMTFKSESGITFYSSSRIPQAEYVALSHKDKQKFVVDYEDSYSQPSRSNDIVDDVIDIASTIAVVSAFDSLFDSSSSDSSDGGSSFDGFGGGDMGGGGSSGDW